MASLIHLGWTEDPVAATFTWARYTRYCHLLHTWATHANVNAELIEIWLSTRWRDRTAHHDTDDRTQPMTALESTLIDILIRHSDPVATALIRWLITGEHTAHDVICLDDTPTAFHSLRVHPVEDPDRLTVVPITQLTLYLHQ